MAWTTPTNRSTGFFVTATVWDNEVVGNQLLLKTSITDDGATWTGVAQKTLQALRGLRLRTHPDQDVAASKVALLGLDEVVMSDGCRYQPTAAVLPLVADITAAGAGGLDTGAEAVSTWYDIYLIGKSSTGLLADLRLMLHKSKTYTVDTSFTTVTNASRALRLATATATDRLAQGVQFASAGPLTFLDVIVQRQGALSGRVWFSLQADVAGSPSGTPLVTSDKLDASVFTATVASTVRVPFRSTTLSVAAGTQYHLVMEGDYTRSDTVNVLLFGVAAGGYANGSAKEFNGTTWAAMSGVGDVFFKAALTLNDAALTMPSGYDQTCRLGWVYNNSAGNFNGFVQSERTVKPLTQLLLGSTTSTAMLLVDASALIPPAAVELIFAVTNTGVNNVYVAGCPDGYSVSVFAGGAGAWSANSSLIAIASANASGTETPILTEDQAVYAAVSGGTGTFYIAQWRW
jgi:hypothetical protein